MEALTILFLLILLGWVLRWRRVLTPESMPALGALALDIALPALVFVVVLGRFRPAEQPGWPRLPVGWVLFTLASLPACLAAGLAARPEVRREFRFCCFYPNALFFPLAILSEMHGPNSTAVARLFLMTFLFPAFFFNTHAMFFRGGLRLNWRMTLHPVLLATVAAAALAFAGLADRAPNVPMKALQSVSALSVPLLMLLLGARIREDFERRGPIYWREIAAFIAIRNVLFPAVFLAALPLLRLPSELAFLLLLQAAMPPVTAAPIMIGRNGGNVGFASQLLLGSYAALALTLPVALWLVGRLA